MKWGAGIAATLVCFTRIPFPWRLGEDAFRRASWHLPLIGWLWVLIASFVFRFSSFHEEGLIFFCLLLPILLSGAMHEDGLADAADGLIGGQTRERRFEIMKDPRVGSYGVISLIFCILGQFLALRAIPSAYRVTALAFAWPVSRAITSLLSQALPYARVDHSRSSAYISRSFAGLLWPIVWTAPAFFVLASDLRWPLLGICIGLTVVLAYYFWKKLGGITGDCLGASVKILETILLWILTALLPAA